MTDNDRHGYSQPTLAQVEEMRERIRKAETERGGAEARLAAVRAVLDGQRAHSVAAWLVGEREGESRLTSVPVVRLHDLLAALEGEPVPAQPEPEYESDAEQAELRAEVERLREINKELVETHNVYLGHVVKVEAQRDQVVAEMARWRRRAEDVIDSTLLAKWKRDHGIGK